MLRCSSFRRSAGRIARATRNSQRNRPMSSAIWKNRPEVDVLVAAVAEVEPQRAARQHLLDAQPLARHRAEHHDEQRAEQHVHAEPLVPRLDAADRRTDVEAGRQPGGGNPEDAELQVPGARDGVGQDPVERDAVEPDALDAVVRGDDAEHDLQQRAAPRRSRSTSRSRAATASPGSRAAGRPWARRPAPAPRAATRSTRPWRRCPRAAG